MSNSHFDDYDTNNFSTIKSTGSGISRQGLYQLGLYHSTARQDLPCSLIHQVASAERCEWIKNTTDCHDNEETLVNYFVFVYCTMESIQSVGIIVLVFWLSSLFIILGTSADNFFCPSLTVIAKLFRLSESVAGVTVLAFGNGAPDIFTSLAGLPSGHGELIFSQLMGGGIFVTTVVVGLICILFPFEMHGKHFLRDDFFYLISVFWTFFVFTTKTISGWETAGFLVIYIVYITVVLLTRKIKRRKTLRGVQSSSSRELAMLVNHSKRHSESHGGIQKTISALPTIRIIKPDNVELSPAEDRPVSAMTINTLLSVNSQPGEPSPTNSHRESESVGSNSSQYEVRNAFYNLMIPALPVRQSSTNANAISDLAVQAQRILKLSMMNEKELVGRELTCRSMSHSSVHFHEHRGLFQSFFTEMNVFLIEDWKSISWYMKIITVVQIPILLILKLLIPVVNLTSVNHGWCKLLNTLQCVTFPLFAVIAIRGFEDISATVPIWPIALIAGTCLGVIVFFTSSTDKAPIYHDFFSILGFLGSILVIFMVANEVVSILRTVGIMLEISEATLGLTILAWGNSLGDLIANVTIAKLGHQKMGFAACFGGGPLIILLGIGLSASYGFIKGEEAILVSYGQLGPTCVVFLVLSLVSSSIILPLMSFQARRSYGYFLLTLYIMFLLVVMLSEFQIIHTFNTQNINPNIK